MLLSACPPLLNPARLSRCRSLSLLSLLPFFSTSRALEWRLSSLSSLLSPLSPPDQPPCRTLSRVQPTHASIPDSESVTWEYIKIVRAVCASVLAVLIVLCDGVIEVLIGACHAQHTSLITCDTHVIAVSERERPVLEREREGDTTAVTCRRYVTHQCHTYLPVLSLEVSYPSSLSHWP